MLEVPLDTPCPLCEAKAFFQNTIELDIPYFGNILSLVFCCKQCGFKHTDVLITDIKSPMRFSLRIEGAEDLSVRVVRSSSGTIRMPELGILVEQLGDETDNLRYRLEQRHHSFEEWNE